MFTGVKKTVVFICTGNTCRSQMAAALFSDDLSEMNAGNITVESAGLMAHEGEPPAKNAVLAMAQLGIDISENHASNLSPKLLQEADLFVCMEKRHADVIMQAGIDPNNIMNLDIIDPYGGDLDTYLKCRGMISSKLPDIYERLGI